MKEENEESDFYLSENSDQNEDAIETNSVNSEDILVDTNGNTNSKIKSSSSSSSGFEPRIYKKKCPQKINKSIFEDSDEE
ncbi:hypothetical protein DSO57_1035789 [Entomophthora muscae]|uniref:Uncharacterized protein n=1 Tax=Entomophthora muscae TaxID=34485 RepID=A0ACC2REC5_9FUNG|nr:hypothetical protein DSO57_1035789 [Entomophthora muscae]